jgi:hypothetical protein
VQSRVRLESALGEAREAGDRIRATEAELATATRRLQSAESQVEAGQWRNNLRFSVFDFASETMAPGKQGWQP